MTGKLNSHIKKTEKKVKQQKFLQPQIQIPNLDVCSQIPYKPNTAQPKFLWKSNNWIYDELLKSTK